MQIHLAFPKQIVITTPQLLDATPASGPLPSAKTTASFGDWSFTDISPNSLPQGNFKTVAAPVFAAATPAVAASVSSSPSIPFRKSGNIPASGNRETAGPNDSRKAASDLWQRVPTDSTCPVATLSSVPAKVQLNTRADQPPSLPTAAETSPSAVQASRESESSGGPRLQNPADMPVNGTSTLSTVKLDLSPGTIAGGLNQPQAGPVAGSSLPTPTGTNDPLSSQWAAQETSLGLDPFSTATEKNGLFQPAPSAPRAGEGVSSGGAGFAGKTTTETPGPDNKSLANANLDGKRQVLPKGAAPSREIAVPVALAGKMTAPSQEAFTPNSNPVVNVAGTGAAKAATANDSFSYPSQLASPSGDARFAQPTKIANGSTMTPGNSAFPSGETIGTGDPGVGSLPNAIPKPTISLRPTEKAAADSELAQTVGVNPSVETN